MLLTNRQINREATAILYTKNFFEINLASPTRPSDVRPRELPRALFRGDEPNDEPNVIFRQPGRIYPHCLYRMDHIQIKVSPAAVWARGDVQDSFSRTGGLFQTLLQSFAYDEAAPANSTAKRTLVLKVKKEYMLPYVEMVLFPRRGSMLHFRNSGSTATGMRSLAPHICPLVEEISKKREVTIVEVVGTRVWSAQGLSPRTEEMREVPLQDLEML
ncbi:MAG: hypothetical protein Q9222_006513 [Ikaeria aurantiellina]